MLKTWTVQFNTTLLTENGSRQQQEHISTLLHVLLWTLLLHSWL